MTKRCKNCGWPNDDNSVKCQKCNSPLDGGAPAAGGGYSTQRQPGGGFQQPTTPSGGENLRKTVSENQFFGTDLSRDPQPQPYMMPNDRPMAQNPTMMECPVCHYQLRQGVSVCPNCGSPISGGASVNGGVAGAPKAPEGKPCPKCGKENPADAKFCSSCGASMSPEAPRSHTPTGNSGRHAGTVNPWMQPSAGTFCTLKPIAWEGENINHEALSFSGSVISLNRANTDPNNQSITSAVQAELTCEDGEWYIIDKSAMHTTYIMASRKMKLHKGDTIILGNRLFEFN